MHRCLLLGILLVASCEKKAPEGLPAASQWKPVGSANDPAGAQANPHGDPPPNPHGAAPGEMTAPGGAPGEMTATPGGAPGGMANPHGTAPAPGAAPQPQPPDMANPHGSSANPHGAMPPGGAMPPNADPNTPSGAIPDPTPPTTPDKRADGRHVLGPFTLVAPSEWVIKPVTSSMRAASWILSAKPNEEAELVVYYFGDGGAGSVQANLDRWVDQFQQADGKPSKQAAKVETVKYAGQDATVVTVSGRYVASAMPGTTAVDKTNQSLIAAIVASPKGPYYFKLVGAKKTVDAHAKRFRTMLSSLKLATP